MVDAIPGDTFIATLRAPAALQELFALDPPLVVVELDAIDSGDLREAADRCVALPGVVAGIGPPEVCGSPAAALADVIIGEDSDALDRITAMIDTNPQAAITLALLLRGAERRSIDDGLVAESAAYSMLQAGTEFATWLAAHPKKGDRAGNGSPIHVERDGNVLHITLTRPGVHNALNTEMRDAWYEAMIVAASDPDLGVLIDGEGPSFCAGGDLEEFGTRADPVSAHLIRLQRSIGGVVTGISDRVEIVVHGACIGAGIELACFAGRVVARPDARFGLPEVGMGLIPGAGGTVSVTRRIGRHLTAHLAFSGETIDAETALSWGLIDEVSEQGPAVPSRH